MGGKIASIVGVLLFFPACTSTRAAAPAQTQSKHAGPSRVEPTSLWSILDASVSPTDPTKSVRVFRDRLVKLPAADILRIHRDFTQHMARAYSWRVWGAAYIINVGCSDDCFEYFRAWLIMQGSTVFEQALLNPDSLADYPHLSQPAELEEALSVTRDAYRAATGTDPDADADADNPELGPGWDFDDRAQMRRRYPKLCRKFGQ